ncbi:MAG: plastocyanin/azurin family copper-binding protein [Hyphomicrobiales bacterium]|nr:plastocyanin/azurin family copper-binding protein [Hyphomicrobiales bacterium]
MTAFSRFGAAASILALVATATPLWAANIITVTEAGEGGTAMTLKLEPASVPAGPATFKVTNDAVSEDHEMIVVRLKSADQQIPLNASKHRVDEAKLKSLGEVSDLKPGASGEMTVKLKAGTYLVFCNLKGHYEAGMAATLTVTP